MRQWLKLRTYFAPHIFRMIGCSQQIELTLGYTISLASQQICTHQWACMCISDVDPLIIHWQWALIPHTCSVICGLINVSPLKTTTNVLRLISHWYICRFLKNCSVHFNSRILIGLGVEIPWFPSNN